MGENIDKEDSLHNGGGAVKADSGSVRYEPKDYSELTLADDFMFCKVLTENPELCIQLTELITGRKVSRIRTLALQKPIRITSSGRGVRFDVYFVDEEGVVYDIEIQTTVRPNLPKRTRYYQSMIDSENLKKGFDYVRLPQTYIVFICLEDPFDRELYRYRFRNMCEDAGNLELGDGAYKVFLNASGRQGHIPDALKKFLEYVKEQKVSDEMTGEIERAVEEARKDEEGRKDYMLLAERDAENRAVGRMEGRAEGRLEERAEGRLEGRMEGRMEGRIISLHDDSGLSPEQISRKVGVPLAQVQSVIYERG